MSCGQPAELGLKDVDLIYFDDEDLSLDAEADHERRLRELFRSLPIKLDVKNEARVHLWYEERFGYAIEPYLSSADAIASFPTTATAVGVRRIRGKLECCAPFGLDDLFGRIVRPNKRQITRAIYEAKVDRWRSIWPRLIFLPWDETVPVRASAAGRRGAGGDGVARAQQEQRAEGGEAKPGRQSQRPDPDPVEQQAEQKWRG